MLWIQWRQQQSQSGLVLAEHQSTPEVPNASDVVFERQLFNFYYSATKIAAATTPAGLMLMLWMLEFCGRLGASMGGSFGFGLYGDRHGGRNALVFEGDSGGGTDVDRCKGTRAVYPTGVGRRAGGL